MDAQTMRNYSARGIITDKAEITAIIKAFGDLKTGLLYTKRMRKYNCIECILISAFGDKTRTGTPFREAARAMDLKARAHDVVPDVLVPYLGGELEDGVDSLSYLFYDYLSSLKSE